MFRAVSSVFTPPRVGLLLFGLCLLVFGYLFLVSGWVVDDAYITFRTIDNFLSGHGLTWNVGERVQAYTHPLWMFLLSAFVFFTKEYFFTSLAVSFLTSVAALSVAFVSLRREALWKPFVFFVLFTTSKAIVDFCSSGLENPLTYLFLVLFYALYFGRDHSARRIDAARTSWLFGIAALSFLNRQDTILLYLAALVAIVWEQRHERRWPLMRAISIGCSPAAAWLLFSLFYYGFAFPNTAYAKMLTSLSLSQRLVRGGVYYALGLRWDSLAFLAIVVSLVEALRRRLWRPVLGLLGVGLYLAYVWATGSAATHMAGRFFAAPFVLGFFISVHLLSSRDVARTILLMAVAYTVVNPVSPWKLQTAWYQTLTRSQSGYIDTLWFAQREGTGLARWKDGLTRPSNPCLDDGARVRGLSEAVHLGGCEGGDPIGFFGFAAGPDKWVVDYLALSDPLLARLQPCVDFENGNWRPGHFRRELPEGYVESILSGENGLRDPGVRQYYAVLKDIVSGRLWQLSRIKSIVLLNLGVYDRLLNPYNKAVAFRARAGQCRF